MGTGTTVTGPVLRSRNRPPQLSSAVPPPPPTPLSGRIRGIGPVSSPAETRTKDPVRGPTTGSAGLGSSTGGADATRYSAGPVSTSSSTASGGTTRWTRARAARRHARSETSTTVNADLVGPGREGAPVTVARGARISGSTPDHRDRCAGERPPPRLQRSRNRNGRRAPMSNRDTPWAPSGPLRYAERVPVRVRCRHPTDRTAAHRARTPARRCARCVAASCSSGTPRRCGERAHRPRQAVRLVRPAAVRVRREERRVGLHEQLVGRHHGGRLPQRAGVAERHGPGEGQDVARLGALPRHGGVAGEAVEARRSVERPPRAGCAARRRGRPGRGSSAACRAAWRGRCAGGTTPAAAAGGE